MSIAPATKQMLQDKADQKTRDRDEADKKAYNLATRGIVDAETRDKVLALGGDATRGSPDPFQVLPDAEAGLTTTTGAFRVPIDPTTAAVPGPVPDHTSEIVGTPVVGSTGHGDPEELYQPPQGGADRTAYIRDIPPASETQGLGTPGDPNDPKPYPATADENVANDPPVNKSKPRHPSDY